MALSESEYDRLFKATESEGTFVSETRTLMTNHFDYLGKDLHLPKEELRLGVRKYILDLKGKKAAIPIGAISPMRAAAAAIKYGYAEDIANHARQREEDDDGYVKQLSQGLEAVASAVFTAESARYRGVNYQATLNLEAVARSLPANMRKEYMSSKYDFYERITARRLERLEEDSSGWGVVFGEAGDILALSIELSPYHNHMPMEFRSEWTKSAAVGAESATLAYSVFYNSAIGFMPAKGIKI